MSLNAHAVRTLAFLGIISVFPIIILVIVVVYISDTEASTVRPN